MCIFRRLLVLCISILTASCATPLKKEEFGSNQPVAYLKTSNALHLCRGDEWMALATTADRSANLLSVGERVNIGSTWKVNTGTWVFTCAAAVSFIPEVNQTYYVSHFTRGAHCYLEVVREDRSTLTGVAVESSSRPGYCSKRN